MSRARSGHPGFSLLETLVACSLFGMLCTLIVAVLIPVLQASARGSVRVEMQQVAVITLDQILADLGQTPPSGIFMATPKPTTTAFALQPLAGVTASGDQVYSDHLVVYFWSSTAGTVLRKTWPPGPSAPPQPLSISLPTVLTPSQVSKIGKTINGTERVLANGAANFTIDAGPGPGVRLPLTVNLILQRNTTTPPQRYQVTRQISLRNTN